MPRQLHIRFKDYYDIAPPIKNSAGDIWSGLPTFGLLCSKPLNCLVITPECDLSNRKVETITYLPIIPVRAYFTTLAFIPNIIREIEGQLQVAEATEYISIIKKPGHFCPPMPNDLKKLDKLLDELLEKPKVSNKAKIAINRAKSGMNLLTLSNNSEIVEARFEDLKTLFGEKWVNKTLEQIIENSYRLDIHFLPADEQDDSWSGVLKHSLVLFRYAFSAPVEIFECAQDITLTDWKYVIDNLAQFIPGALAFSEIRPLKRSCLKSRFLADLITRYVAMHIRLGSPDFTKQTVDEYVKQIGED